MTPKVDITPYLTQGMIACKGGKTGTKVHKAYSGSSVTLCGCWLKYKVDAFRVRDTQLPMSVLCEKCYGITQEVK